MIHVIFSSLLTHFPFFHPILSSWHVYTTLLRMMLLNIYIFCKNSLWRSLWTCPPTTYQKQCISFQQSKKKGTCLYIVTLDDFMFKLSSKQHCITILGRVVHQVKGLIGVSFSFVNQPNQMTKATCKCNFEVCTRFIIHNKNHTYERQRDFWLLQREAQLASRIRRGFT